MTMYKVKRNLRKLVQIQNQDFSVNSSLLAGAPIKTCERQRGRCWSMVGYWNKNTMWRLQNFKVILYWTFSISSTWALFFISLSFISLRWKIYVFHHLSIVFYFFKMKIYISTTWALSARKTSWNQTSNCSEWKYT